MLLLLNTDNFIDKYYIYLVRYTKYYVYPLCAMNLQGASHKTEYLFVKYLVFMLKT